MRLRSMTTSDNSAVREVIHTVMPEFGAVGPGFALSDPEVDAMAEAYAGPGHAYVVIEDARGNIVGGGGFAPLEGGPSDVAELRKMYLYASVRGQGLGRRLLQHLIEGARKAGFRHLYLETMGNMTSAQALYERFGFRRLDGPWGQTGHGGCDVHYAKDLAPSSINSTP
ncbi:MAG: GNAT family N-acetyltransferase [Myxococcota bacterium]